MKVCPNCSREFPDNVKFCPDDGQTLRAKSASADLVGQVVADRYHIIKKLGEGGMGAVYLGEHVKMGRKSAIKVMAAAMIHDPDAVARFNREASNASRISHPNVCQIFDFGETPDGLIYLAMEFIEGQSLKDLIEKEGAISPVRAASIIKQSADALQAAHDLGIVHRDIKPDNIMIVRGRDGTDIVKVVDFGIARAVGGDDSSQKVTKTGLVVGTPEYMSPEQLSGDKLDGRSDIYSLALVLYRMITGVLPFEADSAQETMIKRLTDDPMPLEQARPDISFPPKMQLVMNTALARSAAERYQAASDFGRDTLGAVAGMAPPSTRVQEAPEGATAIMSKEELTQATKAQSASPAKKKGTPPTASPARRETAPTAAAPAAGKSNLVPIVGGGLGVVAIAAVAVFMMKGSGNHGANGLAQADTMKQQQIAGNTNPDTAKAPGTTKTEVVPPPGTNRTPNITNQKHEVTVPPNTTTTRPPAAANWADTLAAANTAFDDDQMGTARRLATAVFNAHDQIPNQMRASAAVVVATTHVSASRTSDAVTWYENAKRFATGAQLDRINSALATLQGNP